MAGDNKTKGAIYLNEGNFEKTIKEAKMPVLVDFYADWCGPCQMAAPIIDKLADEYQGKMLIAKLNVDENNQVSANHGVMSIPTVIIFNQNGDKVEELAKQIGFPGEAGYKKMIEDALTKAK